MARLGFVPRPCRRQSQGPQILDSAVTNFLYALKLKKKFLVIYYGIYLSL